MPEHMIPVLECDAVIDIIIVCDSLLYKVRRNFMEMSFGSNFLEKDIHYDH
jgi:hypothetical protein